uniref:Uncharacterized protein n=1 Tax=Cyclophora tenuis TaxID=216820 RepID=A0A7S1D4B0_CYCTE|mmetsp:Transcript_22587/g.38404  ORF Transcript_22587/g.38404 Transcript_22587/m.38404 type:complete len:145 (+) Transcript_22587:75-509(+)
MSRSKHAVLRRLEERVMELRRDYTVACADREWYRSHADLLQEENQELRGAAYFDAIRTCRELRLLKMEYKDLRMEILEMKQQTVVRRNQIKELEDEMGTITEAHRQLRRQQERWEAQHHHHQQRPQKQQRQKKQRQVMMSPPCA